MFVSLLHTEGAARWTAFVTTFVVVAAWESFQPRRELSSPAERRWRNHGALLLVTAIVNTSVLRIGPVALAVMVSGSRFGILNKPVLPFFVRCAITIAALDMVQYWAHRSMHYVWLLWRVHRVHHSDPDYDVSTAARFHPLEDLYAQGLRFAAVAILAPPAAGVFVTEVMTEIVNLLVHANASLPSWLERGLRWIVITPDLHRIHHSQDIDEQQDNLGQTFVWWDRLFGTYRGAASASETDFRTGLAGLEGRDEIGVAVMLAEPFQSVAENIGASPPVQTS